MQLPSANRLLSFSVLGLGGLVCSNSMFAAGFALRNNSASGVGTSLSSETVNTFDATGMFSNPAIMSTFKGNAFSLNINSTSASIKASDATANIYAPYAATDGLNYDAVQGNNSVDKVSDPIVIPALAAIFQINDAMHAGLTFTVPYGTNTEYDSTWTGRYHAIKTELKTFDVGLAFSYKFNDIFAAGVSFDWQKAEGELTQASDLGLISYASTLNAAGKAKAAAQGYAAQAAAAQAAGDAAGAQAAGAAAQTAGTQAQAARDQATALIPAIGRADAITAFKGDSTAFAYGIGFLIHPAPESRIGISYRGSVKHEAKGDLTWAPTNGTSGGLLAKLAAADTRFNNSSDAKLDLNLPSVLSIGYAHDLTDVTIYGNVTSTTWSSFDELTPEWAGTRSVTQLKWKDTLYYAVGAEYRICPEWTLRGGVGQDQSVTGNNHRTPRTPDADRTAVSIGAGYKVGSLNLNVAYQRLFVETSKIHLKADSYTDNNTRGDLNANLDIHPSIAVVSAGYSF